MFDSIPFEILIGQPDKGKHFVQFTSACLLDASKDSALAKWTKVMAF